MTSFLKRLHQISQGVYGAGHASPPKRGTVPEPMFQTPHWVSVKRAELVTPNVSYEKAQRTIQLDTTDNQLGKPENTRNSDLASPINDAHDTHVPVQEKHINLPAPSVVNTKDKNALNNSVEMTSKDLVTDQKENTRSEKEVWIVPQDVSSKSATSPLPSQIETKLQIAEFHQSQERKTEIADSTQISPPAQTSDAPVPTFAELPNAPNPLAPSPPLPTKQNLSLNIGNMTIEVAAPATAPKPQQSPKAAPSNAPRGLSMASSLRRAGVSKL